MKKNIIVLILFSQFYIPAYARLNRGVEVSGGSAIIYNEQHVPRIIDYYQLPDEFNPVLKDLRTNSSKVIESDVLNQKISKSSGFSSLVSYQETEKLIESWNDVIIGFLANTTEASLRKINFRWTTSLVESYQHNRPGNLPSGKSLYTVAFYQHKFEIPMNISVAIDEAAFHKLPFLDQQGVFIHEALRFEQLSLGMGYSDESLQRVTATMLVCEPTIFLKRYVERLILNYALFTKQSQPSFEKIIKEHCRVK